MGGVQDLLTTLKQHGHAEGHFLGLLHILIGRRLQKKDGTVLSTGLTWRELATLLKKVRWDKEAVRELGLNPADLPPRDRQRYWYVAIAHAAVDSDKAMRAGDRFASVLRKAGCEAGPAPGK
jgi:hypothetical protein